MRKVVPIGKVKFGNKILVSDPMYKIGTWCTVPLDNVKAGLYNAEVEIADCGIWGERVAAIRVHHVDYSDVSPMVLIGCDSNGAGVDSGLCGIWDYDEFAKIKSDENLDEAFFNRACNIDRFGTEKFGALSSSGFGDGSYPVYAGFVDDKVVSLEVQFVAEDEEDE